MADKVYKMELQKNLKTLAHCRKSSRHSTQEVAEPAISQSLENSAHLELLQKIAERLPTSHRIKFEKFKELFTDNSLSPVKGKLQVISSAKDSPTVVRRQRLYSENDKTDIQTIVEKTQILITEGTIGFSPEKKGKKRRSLLVKGTSKISESDSLRKQKYYEQHIYMVDLNDQMIEDKFSFHGLFVGDFIAANDCSTLLCHSIRGIITIGQENEPAKYPCIQNGYFVLPLIEENFIRQSVENITKTLNFMLSKGNVLIHHKNGSNLAVIIVIAFIMKKFHFGYHAAKEKVLRCDPPVTISSKQENELLYFERNFS